MSLICNFDARKQVAILRPDGPFSLGELEGTFRQVDETGLQVVDLRDVVRWRWRSRDLETLTVSLCAHPLEVFKGRTIGFVARHPELRHGLATVALSVNQCTGHETIQVFARAEQLCAALGVSPWDDFEQLQARLQIPATELRGPPNGAAWDRAKVPTLPAGVVARAPRRIGPSNHDRTGRWRLA